MNADRGWLALLLALSSCGGCDDKTPPPPPPAPTEMPAPEGWTLGAARADDALVLPPACSEREPMLRAVLPRDIRFAAAESRLGELWVAEGTADREGGWHADSAGIVTMAHGPTTAVPTPWPTRAAPVAAIDGGSWRLVYDFDVGSGPQLAMWHRGEREVLGAALEAIDLSCDGDRCALLVRRDDAAEAWLGAASEPAALWQRVPLGGQPLAVELVAGGAMAMMADSDRVTFLLVSAGAPDAPSASIRTAARPLAALATPVPMVMTESPHRIVDGCASEGGVRVELVGSSGQQLRSAEPPRVGVLLRLSRGYLAVWLAPQRCASRRHLVYAVPLGADGRPGAPVTSVGVADAIAAASSGSNVDLWLHDAAERTITWVPARCTL